MVLIKDFRAVCMYNIFELLYYEYVPQMYYLQLTLKGVCLQIRRQRQAFLKMHITSHFITYSCINVTRVCRVLKGYMCHKHLNKIPNY